VDFILESFMVIARGEAQHVFVDFGLKVFFSLQALNTQRLLNVHQIPA
jgi:hypothetical protein